MWFLFSNKSLGTVVCQELNETYYNTTLQQFNNILIFRWCHTKIEYYCTSQIIMLSLPVCMSMTEDFDFSKSAWIFCLPENNWKLVLSFDCMIVFLFFLLKSKILLFSSILSPFSSSFPAGLFGSDVLYSRRDCWITSQSTGKTTGVSKSLMQPYCASRFRVRFRNSVLN